VYQCWYGLTDGVMGHVSYVTGMWLISAFMIWMALCFSFLVFTDVSKYNVAPGDYTPINSKPMSDPNELA
jgi:hypothetical protein